MSDIIIKQVLTRVGGHIGGTLGTGMATQAWGGALSIAEMVNLVSNYREGRVTASDVVSATLAVEVYLLGLGIVAGTAGIPLAVAVVGAATVAAVYMRDGTAIQDAWEVFEHALSQGSQPWDFLPDM